MQNQYWVLGETHHLLRHATEQGAANAGFTATAHHDQVGLAGSTGSQNFGVGFADSDFTLRGKTPCLCQLEHVGHKIIGGWALNFGTDHTDHMQRRWPY